MLLKEIFNKIVEEKLVWANLYTIDDADKRTRKVEYESLINGKTIHITIEFYLNTNEVIECTLYEDDNKYWRINDLEHLESVMYDLILA